MNKNNMKIHLKKTDITRIVKECVTRIIENKPSGAWFNSYYTFLAFLDESDGTMEYFYLSKEKTGLPMDIYLDDCASYKRYNHPLWMYVCDGPSHNAPLVPISISSAPKIEVGNYNPVLPAIMLSLVREFIKVNKNLIEAFADGNTSSIELEKQLTSPSTELYATRSTVNEMAKLEDEYTNLGFDIFIDASPRTAGHKEYRIKYPINKEGQQGHNSHNYVPMSICENPEFLPPAKINQYNAIADTKRKKMVQDFIKKHWIELQEVSDGIKDLNEYKLELRTKQTEP